MTEAPRYARAGRCPPGTRRAVRTRGVVRDGCVVVNQAAAEFQQRTGHPRSLPSSVYRGGKLTDWFNTRRVLEPIGYIPPAEYEERYYQQASVAYVT